MKYKIIFDEKEVELLYRSVKYIKNKLKKDADEIETFDSIFEKLEKSEKNVALTEQNQKYLMGLSQKTIHFFDLFTKEYATNLYHSIVAVRGGTMLKEKSSNAENVYRDYYNRYKTERPLICDYKIELKELTEHICARQDKKERKEEYKKEAEKAQIFNP